ncbi:MAG TPA: hypothetical protein VIQ60_06120, partial [Gemmatimonadaceae bacterium]
MKHPTCLSILAFVLAACSQSTQVHPAPAPAPTPAQAGAPVRVDSLPTVVMMAPATKEITTPSSVTGNLPEFARLDGMDWPGPNQYRAADGSPGPEYWQQRADYKIA